MARVRRTSGSPSRTTSGAVGQREPVGQVRDREAWLRAVCDHALDGFLAADVESKQLVFANPAFCNTYGYAPEEVTRLTIRDLHPPEALSHVVEQFERQAAGRQTMAKDIPVRHRDGSVSYVDIHSSALDVAGRRCLLGLFRDVTERRRAEELLRVSEAKYRAATELLSDYIFRIRVDPGGRAALDWVSGNFERITGRRLDDVARPEQWLKVVQPSDAARLLAAYQAILQGGGPTRVELGTTVLRDGKETRRWVEVHAKPELNAATGCVEGIVGAVRDITDRRRAEEEAERLALVVKHSGELVSLARPDGRLLFLNEAGVRRLGLAPEDVGRHHFLDIISDAFKTKVEGEVLPALLERGSWEGDLQYRNVLTGDLIDVRAMSFAIKAPQSSELLYLATVSRDVSELRRMEERLRQTEKLTAIGQLAGGVAHDFQNHLTVVLGCADVLRSSLADPSLRKETERIITAARCSSELTRNLLAFARKGHFAPVSVDLDLLLGEVAAIIERSFDKRTVVRRELAALPARVLGDPGQLQSALLNLALNARDAMPGGGELLLRSCRAELGPPSANPLPAGLQPGSHVVVSVADTGAGMSPEVLRHLYEPFFTTKPPGMGTGLGLATVYGTVRRHGGAIEVESRPGHGSTFSLYFPLHEGAPPPATQPEPVAQDGLHSRVLVVDDEPAVGEVAVTLLGAIGAQPTFRCGGAAAIDFYREHWCDVDLVVLDLNMSGMSGRETYRELRRINPTACVLLSSGCGLVDDAKALLAEGALGLLQKPFTLAELSDKLSQR